MRLCINKFIFVVLLNIPYSLAMQDIRPGSRTVYVGNHDEKGEVSDFLQVLLRACTCQNINAEEFCGCWSNFDEADQPAIQGDLMRAYYCKKICGDFFPGFSIKESSEAKAKTISIPSPHKFYEILKFLNMAHVELVSGNSLITTDEYLKMLARGKIPLAGIPKPQEVSDTSMLYHLYMHDLVNHSILWPLFPKTLRDLITKRADKILSVAGLIKQSFEHDQKVLDLVELLKFFAAFYFDTSMGSLNNNVFCQAHPFTWESKEEYEKIIDFYEGTCNFGIRFRCNKKILITPSSDNDFIYFLFLSRSNNFVDYFKKIASSQNNNDFDSYKTIEKDPLILSVFNRLKECPWADIWEARQKMLDKIIDLLKISPVTCADDHVSLMPIETFYDEVKSNLTAAIQTYNNSKL